MIVKKLWKIEKERKDLRGEVGGDPGQAGLLKAECKPADVLFTIKLPSCYRMSS